MEPIIIGIAGGSASGKSSIANILKERYVETQSVVITTMINPTYQWKFVIRLTMTIHLHLI